MTNDTDGEYQGDLANHVVADMSRDESGKILQSPEKGKAE